MADKSSSLTTSAINRAKWSSGSQSCSEGGNKNSCSRLQTRNRLLISESYEIPARAHNGFSLIAYLSPTHSPSVTENVTENYRKFKNSTILRSSFPESSTATRRGLFIPQPFPLYHPLQSI